MLAKVIEKSKKAQFSTLKSKPNVLISGSGIAGSVFSFWLLRAYPDAKITIVERSPELRLTGASVDIRSSAVDIIKWMGKEEEIRKFSTKETGVQFVTSDDREVATIKSTGREDLQSFTSEFEIFRGELAKIFIEPSLPYIDLVFDEYIDQYEQDEDGVTVTFAKSKEVKKFDLLVAADGLSSKIRGQMMNTHPSEQIHDEGFHIAYFSIKKDMLEKDRLSKWYNTTGGRVIFLRPDPHPEGRTRGNIGLVTTRNDIEMKSRLNKAIKEGNESFMTLLEELFEDAGWKAEEVLKEMRESDDFYCSLFAQVRCPKLQDGRVVLLGDSGYATPGFGTSLAIIGGYILAGEILANDGDVKAALKNYENLMVPYVKSQQGDDNVMQYLNPQTTWGIKIRDGLLWTINYFGIIDLGMKVSSWLGYSEKKIDMPNYQWTKSSPT